jgi:hypothetical protein
MQWNFNVASLGIKPVSGHEIRIHIYDFCDGNGKKILRFPKRIKKG